MIDPEKDEKLRALANAVSRILAHEALDLSETRKTTLESATATLFRPYLLTVREHFLPAKTDGRTKDWGISLMFWDVTEGEEERAELLAETDYEVVKGFPGVGQAIIGYFVDLHDTAAYPHLTQNMLKGRLKALRPCIARSEEGSATMRLRYELKGRRYLCTARVQRTSK